MIGCNSVFHTDNASRFSATKARATSCSCYKHQHPIKKDMSEKGFERCFIHVSIELATEQNMNHAQFAKRIYGDSATSATRWRMMRNGDKGVYPKVSLSFARDIAKALDMDLPSLIFRVDQHYKLNEEQYKQKKESAA